jgi:hypothetical protein
MNVEQAGSTGPHSVSTGSSEDTERIPTTREVLQELFQLLEEYAPTWYTEEHHNRAVAALQGAHEEKAPIPDKEQ